MAGFQGPSEVYSRENCPVVVPVFEKRVAWAGRNYAQAHDHAPFPLDRGASPNKSLCAQGNVLNLDGYEVYWNLKWLNPDLNSPA